MKLPLKRQAKPKHLRKGNSFIGRIDLWFENLQKHLNKNCLWCLSQAKQRFRVFEWMYGNQFPIANYLWNILIRSRFKPILLCGDIEKAFLQIRIRESERDVLRFHWIKNSDPSYRVHPLTVHTWRYFKEHFQYYINEYPTLIAAISEDMYIDDLVSGKQKCIKQKSIIKKLDLICLSGTTFITIFQYKIWNWTYLR